MLPADNVDTPIRSAPFGPAQDSSNQPALLNQNESDLMGAFFSNPDGFDMGNSFPGLDWGADTKFGGSGSGVHLNGLDPLSQTISNPAATLSGAMPSNFHTHNQHLDMADQTGAFGNPTNATSEDDWKAATSLYSISSHAQDQAHASAFSGAAAGSWGNIGTNHPMMPAPDATQSPLTSSGRQSANSYQSQPHNTSLDHLQSFQPGLSQQQQLHHILRQQQLRGTPRVPQGSLNLDTSGINFFPPETQRRMAQSADPFGPKFHRPLPVTFGSDNNFRTHGYQNPNVYASHEDEKASNLNNVPLAAQAAAIRHPHMQGYTPAGYSRTFQRPSLPSGNQNFHSTSSSPSNLGGLPFTSPLSNANRHGHPYNQMARRTVEDEYDDDADADAEIEDINPRKRRKSQMERDDDAEYSPQGHVKSAVPKRGLKASKALDGSDDDDDEAVTPSWSRSAIKRRKSNAAARTSLASSHSASSSDIADDAIDPPSTSRKKVRSSQARNNLTEEEKRMNHIRSEKHRRDLIKMQYEHLDNLVPGLKSGKTNLSRADILTEIVRFVESTVAGNVAMERALEDLHPALTIAGASNSGSG